MTKQLLSSLSFFGPRKPKQRKRTGTYRRTLSMESLESRQMLSITPLANLSAAGNTGEKPQSKVFEYAGEWWTVMPSSSGASVYRLDGTTWTATQTLASGNGFRADVKVVNDLAHVLLFDGSSSQLATLQYDPADNRFEPWSLRPQVVAVPISSGAEMATLDVDSTGRMWVAYDVSSRVEVRYSDGLYTSWSAPIALGSLGSDDISDIVAMPNGKIGVMWSNQSADRFGFRVHVDGAAPTAWSADEVPASQSALSVGGGMADDHIHLASTSDGTVYAAVKTSYDSSGYPKIALLVRRPNGRWDNLYTVDTSGTRGIVVVNEAAGKLIVAYTSTDHASSIVYRESPLGNIAFGPRQTLMSGSLNDVTSTKYTSTNEIVFLSKSRGALFRFDTATPIVNQAPAVNAGPDRSIVLGANAALDGTASDDGLPTPGGLSTSWTKVSGPGTVTFGNGSAVDTTAAFSAAGTYVLRLTASDGQRTTADEMTVIVTAPAAPVVNQPPLVNAGPDRAVVLGNSAVLDGTVSDDGLPTPAALTSAWTKVSGPGTVTFASPSAVDTTASFTAAGTYVLRLTASDGPSTSGDEMSVIVSQPAGPPPGSGGSPTQIAFQDGLFPNVTYAGTRDTKIVAGKASSNYGTVTTFDIDGSPDISALLKWDTSAVPTGSIIASAAIELNVTNATDHNYEVYALQRAWDELSATWQQFAAGQTWSGAGANGSGDHGTAVLGQLGPASKGIYRIALNDAGVAAVQAWINNPGANHGVILKDYAVSDGVDFSSSEAATVAQRPKLIINYQPVASAAILSSVNLTPNVNAGANRTVARGQSLPLNGIVNDDGRPGLDLLTVLWSKVSGPSTGTVTFGNAAAASTTAVFSAAGSYVLRLTASDGELSAFDELTVMVT